MPTQENYSESSMGIRIWSIAYRSVETVPPLPVASRDNTVHCCGIRTPENTHPHALPGTRIGIRSVSFSPDGSTLASASVDRHGPVVGCENGENTGEHSSARLLGTRVGSVSVAFSPDGATLASASGTGKVLLWDVKTGEHLRTFSSEHRGWVDSVSSIRAVSKVSFSPDGATLASATGYRVLLWDVETGEHFRTLIGHTGNVYDVSFSPDGSTLASGSREGTVLLWEYHISAFPPPRSSGDAAPR